MILRATHNAFLYAFFRLYTRLRIRGAFRKVIIEGDVADRGLAILVFANHFSWWDGFWIMYMNMKLFRRRFYFMMLEEQLLNHRFFNKTGGFSVKRGTRSIIESINYTIELLRDNNNMVMLFPQGKIESMHVGRFVFEKGAIRIIEQASSARVLFAVNLVEYYSSSKPTLYMYLAEYSRDDQPDPEEAYNEFYRATLQRHSARKEGI